jgi:hypothetical protein
MMARLPQCRPMQTDAKQTTRLREHHCRVLQLNPTARLETRTARLVQATLVYAFSSFSGTTRSIHATPKHDLAGAIVLRTRRHLPMSRRVDELCTQ